MPDEQNTITMTGYHGCNADNVSRIRAENFRCSRGDHHWLGEGVYFFGTGISDPVEDAKKWAIAESWDNEIKGRRYDKFSVLSATISTKNHFDMTQDSGKSKVNIAREALSSRMRPIGGYIDSNIIQWLISKYGFDVVIQDFYIQMTNERRRRIKSRFPNVRVICVRNPDSAIDKDSISVTYTAIVPTHPQ